MLLGFNTTLQNDTQMHELTKGLDLINDYIKLLK